MIIDKLSHSDRYVSLHKDFKQVFEFIKNNDLNKKECGSYQIRDNEVYFNLQEYTTKRAQKLEAHKKYIDIQVIVSGEEYMGWINLENTAVIEEYNEEKDVMFLKGETDLVKADKTLFVIFYPEDAHMPALSIKEDTKVKKAIFKIRL